MKKNKTRLFIIFFVIFFIAVITGIIVENNSDSKSQKWNSLDYNVTVNSDRSIDVIETWDVSIRNTNTIFKNFNLSSGVTNVKVALVENGVEKYLQQINVEQYYVDRGCYYDLQTNPSTFEIAWNVDLDNSKGDKIYKVYYTIEDAVKVYGDCTELYWKFLDESNLISGKNVTGIINLPKKVSNIEKLRVWAHGDLSGEINRVSEDKVSFKVPKLTKNTMLEVRIVTEENIYEGSGKFSNSDKLQSIIAEEQAWADEANSERYKSRLFVGIILFICALIFVLFYKKIKKYKELEKELVERYTMNIPEIEYFREIPDEENATPSRALYLEQLKDNTSYMKSDENVFVGTLLDLSLKGFISFENISKKEFKIIFNDGISKQLVDDEKIVYDILEKARVSIDSQRNYITTDELSSYTKKEYDDFMDKLEKINSLSEEYHIKSGNIDIEKKKIIDKLKNKSGIHTFLLLFPIVIMFIVTVGMLDEGINFSGIWLKVFVAVIMAIIATIIGNGWCIYAIGRILKQITFLSEKGYTEELEWKGLKKYMEDYSLLKDRTISDIILWEKFLVYATTFGISEKVISQLKIVHPEMFDANNEFYNRCAYWSVVYNSSTGGNGFTNLSNGLGKAYNTASSAWSAAHSSSSSSGSGGGFSGGGGGRSRWRRLRWKIENKIYKVLAFYIKIL